MRYRFVPVALTAILLQACTIAPANTSLTRIAQSAYHVDHPEYITAERRADFTGSHPIRVLSDAGTRAMKADIEVCTNYADARTTAWRILVDSYWTCMWNRGWRWDTD